MATKYSIAEQVQLRLQGGYPETAANVQIDDIIPAVGQKLNSLLRLQFFQTTLPSGETIPDGLMIATYDKVAVTGTGKRATAVLPTFPIILPRNMGIYEVSCKEDFSDLYIPIQPGQTYLLQGQPLISDLLDQVGFEVYGNKLIFSKDITLDDVKHIYIKMVVVDVSRLTDYELLPMPADMEDMVVNALFKDFAPVGVNDSGVDNYVTKKEEGK